MKRIVGFLSLMVLVVAARASDDRGAMTENNLRMEATVESKYNFADTVAKIQEEGPKHKFSVLHVHKVSEIMKSKGIEREPLTIVEICNAQLASQALEHDIRTAVMMPCPVVVYQKGSKVFVMTIDAEMMMAEMYEGEVLANIAKHIDAVMEKILGSVKK